jgi:hypothetical protein
MPRRLDQPLRCKICRKPITHRPYIQTKVKRIWAPKDWDKAVHYYHEDCAEDAYVT